MISSNNSIWSDLLYINDFLQIKQKIKLLDTHETLPLIVFADTDSNIYLYDVNQKIPIRIFNNRSYFNEQMNLKDLKFFSCNDKKFVHNYEITEVKKMKGIQFNSRNNIIILTFEKSIIFYSIITQNIIKIINQIDLDQRLPVKCEVYNYSYLLILNSDGNLVLWDLIEWNLVKTINKNIFGKAIGNFYVGTDSNEEKFAFVTTITGNLFCLDVLKKDSLKKGLESDNRNKHECPINTIDYNPLNNYHGTCSKNSLFVTDIKNPGSNHKITNFHFFKNQKINGMFSNINSCFPKTAYFIYGKSSALCALDINLENLKNKKVEPKDLKTLIFYTYDLDISGLPKFNEKPFKIYNAKTLNNSTDYIILGTNKGVVILKYNEFYKPDIISSNKLIELNNNEKLFAYMSGSGNNIFELSLNIPFKNSGSSKSNKDMQAKFTSLIPAIFDSSQDPISKKIKVEFSYDGIFMSIVNIFSQNYVIYNMQLNDELKFVPTAIKSGKGIDVIWCNYANYFAVVSNSENSAIKTQNNIDKKILKCYFSLSVYKIISNANSGKKSAKPYEAETVYSLNDFASHKVFGGHFLCVYEIFEKSDSNEIGIKDNLRNITYSMQGNIGLFFYNWNEKVKLNYFLSDEPNKIVSSLDLESMIIVYEKNYVILKVNPITLNLEYKSTHYYSILDTYLYESFVFFFLTDKGLYFHIINEENGSPIKITNASEECSNLHLRISKKTREKTKLYKKKFFSQKILGVYKNVIAMTDSFNNTSIMKIEHPLIDIIDLILCRKFSLIPNVLEILEKKYASKCVAIFDYYFSVENESSIRNLLGNNEVIESLQLYKHLDFLKKDLMNNLNPNIKPQIEKIIKSGLVKAVANKNEDKIAEIYEFCSENNLIHTILCSKLIDCNLFLKSLLTNNRNFESYVFNENYKIDESMGEKILGKAFEKLNSKSF